MARIGLMWGIKRVVEKKKEEEEAAVRKARILGNRCGGAGRRGALPPGGVACVYIPHTHYVE